MTTTAANVRVGVTGEVNFAVDGTTLPTNSSTALDAAFTGLGYNTESGINETINRTTNKIRAWQNGDVVRTVTSEHDVEYAFDMLETTAETLETYYGEGSFSGGTVEVAATNGRRGSWVIEVIDGDDVCRIVIPDGEVTTDSSTVSYTTDGAVVYPVTITAYPDSGGVKAYKYYGALV